MILDEKTGDEKSGVLSSNVKYPFLYFNTETSGKTSPNRANQDIHLQNI